MTRIIAVASGKGGVGKTTLVSNLAAALAQFNKSVVALDGNLTTSNLGIHLGIPLYPVTLQDILKGKAKLKDAVYYHSAGFRIIPADVSLSKLMTPEAGKIMDTVNRLTGDADFVLIDTAAGLGKEALSIVEVADEMIAVAHPELPSLTDALKVVKISSRYGTDNIGVVINRVRNRPHELHEKHVEDFLGVPVIGKVHEDHNIGKSIAKREPIVTYSPKSVSAQQFKKIAAALVGKEYQVRVPAVHRLFGWLRY